TLPFGETYDDNQNALGAAGPEWQNGSKCMETGEDGDGHILDHFRIYTFDRALNNDLDESPIEGDLDCGPFGGNSGGAIGSKISQSELEQQITASGLPTPTTDAPGMTQYGAPVEGYEQLLQQLQDNPDAAWAAQQLLNGEKQW